jgi:antitoxin ParD1/3/4
MNIVLSPPLEQFVKQQIDHGAFRSPTEVVEEALRQMQADQAELTEIRAKIERGLADIEAGRTFTPDEARAELKARRAGWAR